jgi:cell division protein FtsI (penicillin-binding protein 3)
MTPGDDGPRGPMPSNRRNAPPRPHRPPDLGRVAGSRTAGRPAAGPTPLSWPSVRRPARPVRPLSLGRTNRRLSAGFGAVLALLVLLGGRLVQLQGVDRAGFAAAAAAQRVRTVELHALRGQVLDRDGTVLAYTDDAQDVTVDPTQVRSVDRLPDAVMLSPLVGRSISEIEDVLAGPGHYGLIANAVPSEAAMRVSQLGLSGIYTQASTRRNYPAGSTAANIVGVVHADGSGAAGIEYAFNDILAGTDGSLTFATDAAGNMNPNGASQRVEPRNGGTVRLTIDRDLQYTVQGYLDAAVKQSGAKDGQVAVLDATTSQVLALAASGTFNPDDPDSISSASLMDPAIQSVFEPGSANKVVTFSGAIENKLISPRSVFTVPDNISIGGVNVSDAWSHPIDKFTATGVLARSSNVGTLEIAQKLGPFAWDVLEEKFGIGERTGIELPGESAGILPDMKDWSSASFANLPIGQGEAMTVLQLAGMYQTIANGGVRVPPRIVSSITRPDGATVASTQPDAVRVVSPQTAQTVRTMLESVTQPGGTGVKAAIPGYRIAGKTGTAQQPDPARGGAYSDWMNWDTFAGIAPADKPQFVVAIMIDNPAHGLEGGDVAAPLYHEIATYELQHARIPPTGSLSKHVPLMVCEPNQSEFSTTLC